MNNWQKIVIKNSVQLILKLQAFLFRKKAFHALGFLLNSLLAKATIKAKKIREVHSLEALGENWQKGFPSNKQVPITGTDNKTIFGEIHTPCPLRATGDVAACYKMMSYDREIIVSQSGGQFFVLQSQAEAGVERCKIAIRLRGEDASDLIQVHER